VTREAGPVQGILAFLNPLLRRPAGLGRLVETKYFWRRTIAASYWILALRSLKKNSSSNSRYFDLLALMTFSRQGYFQKSAAYTRMGVCQ
jgi:hypothetical protein